MKRKRGVSQGDDGYGRANAQCGLGRVYAKTTILDSVFNSLVIGENDLDWPFLLVSSTTSVFLRLTCCLHVQLITFPAFWFSILLGLGACLLPDVAMQALRRRFYQHDYQIIQACTETQNVYDYTLLSLWVAEPCRHCLICRHCPDTLIVDFCVYL
jgi:hypothetical protein